jgi:hypothetical protein
MRLVPNVQFSVTLKISLDLPLPRISSLPASEPPLPRSPTVIMPAIAGRLGRTIAKPAGRKTGPVNLVKGCCDPARAGPAGNTGGLTRAYRATAR